MATNNATNTPALTTDGQLLIGNTSAGKPSAATLTAGSNITITNAGGSITIAASGGGSTYPDPSNTYIFYSDCAGPTAATFGMASNSTGTGAGSQESTEADGLAGPNHWGVWRLRAGTTTTSWGGLFGSSSNFSTGSAGGGTLTAEFLVYTPAAVSDGTNNYRINVGFGDSATGPTASNDFIGFTYNQGTNSGAWTGTCKTGGSTSTSSDNTTLMSPATWTKLKIIVDSTASNARFYVNGSELTSGAISSNIPSSTSATFSIIISIVNNGANDGATNRELYIDYVNISKAFSTPR